METLKKQLFEECSYRMRDETMEEFVALMSEEIELKEYEPLIPYGRFDNNVYVLKSGIMRSVYFDGPKEKTFAFALPGTVMISYYSFYMREPSFSQFEACCDSVVMKVPRAKFVELSERSHDFAQWMMWMSLGQLWFGEKKRTTVSGDAMERFRILLKIIPDIMDKVSMKTVASYIGITPQYLSKLKRQYLRAGSNG
ncbi:MAG: Crp/Fnr family transcriptional regulator [Alistipes sp.]|jgi:CRP-like cAMP-binding protein|nr:Crp/Fnr family transcriptional regulator [Alistipes sp.]